LYNSDVQCNHCKRELRDLVFNSNTCELENIKKKGGEIMKRLYSSGKRSAEEGQGLVEYALVLVLVAVIVIAILLILGSTVGNVFNEVARELERAGAIRGAGEGNDVVVITRAGYNSGTQELHLDATSDGDYDPGVTLTASPGGVMEAKSDHYCLKPTLTGCPCTVTVTSSKGGSASVTVGP
jgi:pilus assembly protein Flp/PilA